MRRIGLAATTLLALGALALPSSAAPKTISKTYTATALPSGLGLTDYCDGIPTTHDKHREPFKAPAAGTLKVSLTGATGDWDAVLLDKGDAQLTLSATMGPGDESYTYRVKKPAEFTLLSCNALGGPTATVKYTFTYGK